MLNYEGRYRGVTYRQELDSERENVEGTGRLYGKGGAGVRRGAKRGGGKGQERGMW